MPCALDSVASLTKMKHLNKIKQNVEKKKPQKNSNKTLQLQLQIKIKLYDKIVCSNKQNLLTIEKYGIIFYIEEPMERMHTYINSLFS